MTSFYTNVQVFGSRILYRGVENGRRIRNKIDYHPTLFVPSQEPTAYTTISGDYVSEIKPGNIRDCRDFVKKYEGVDNFKIYGNQKYEYAYIADLYANADVYWDRTHLNIANLDIEVGSENGFPDPATASEPVTAITIRSNSKFLVYGLGEFNNTRSDIQYIRCNSESDLLRCFLTDWSCDYPDIVTGWNIKFFDIPYLVNRIAKVLGQDSAKRLSPWNVLNEREVFIMGRPQRAFMPLGVAVLDYIELYKKFVLKPQDSYKLDAICHDELGEKKLSYEEYGDLHKLLSTKSQDVEVSENKPKEDMQEFEKWCLLKNKLKKHLKK
jgi:DNA polymerase elongation subunit (family B)